MADKDNRLTTGFGKPVDDDQNSVTAGPRGPVLMQDVHLLEKLGHFDRERIPERVVHAKGAGAYGYFEVTEDVTKYTRAAFLSEVGKRTDVFVRFSTVGGEKGSADTERDPRGFAIKFYTEEGNYDMTGNNTPVFFIRDPLKFSDFIHTQKRNPQTNLKDPDMFWDFLSLTPESIHQVTILFSDRGTPDGYRHMNGYSSHSYVWSNAAGEQFYVQYHFKTEQGIRNLTAARGRRAQGHGPRLRHARPLRGHRPRRLPVVAARDADHAGGRGRVLQVGRPRHHQGLAARRLPAHHDRPPGAGQEPAELLRRGGAGGVRARAPSSRASSPATTRCCRPGCSATTTRTSTGSGRTITCCR